MPIPVMAEVNLRFAGGPRAAFARLDRLWERVSGGPAPARRRTSTPPAMLSMRQVQRLVSADAAPVAWPQRSIHRVWPDFPVQLHVDASCVTVKADAARRSFNAYGNGIVWAVVDTGIDGGRTRTSQGHHTLDDPQVEDLHRDFTGAASPRTGCDEAGHGTHVAGIIAGASNPGSPGSRNRGPCTSPRTSTTRRTPRQPMNVPRTVDDPAQLAGMAPRAKLVSLKAVRSGGTPDDRVNRVIAALAYVREVNGESTDGMRIHGVNLSVGYEFDPRWFACGRSPLCKEVDKLVRSGVVVVVAAGNTGYGAVDPEFAGPTKFGLGMTINDPGNAERAITVGSTHRDAPHAYGVSYFSSKGPTGDGRRKPDLVAPGERITSCAAGRELAAVLAGEAADDTAVYVEDSGTSMAAPHVSGAHRRADVGAPGVHRLPRRGQADRRRVRDAVAPQAGVPGCRTARPHARSAVDLAVIVQEDHHGRHEIAGLPFWELTFDADGDPDGAQRDAFLDEVGRQGVTDVIFFAHGWNNDRRIANELFTRFFTVLAGQVPAAVRGRVGLVGVVWPSQRWSDEPIPDFLAGGGGVIGDAASVDDTVVPDGAPADPTLDEATLAGLRAQFPAATAPLDEMAQLLAGPATTATLTAFHRQLGEFSRLAHTDSGPRRRRG